MPRLPTGPFSTHRTGCYGCIRNSPSDGSCGVHGYPCVHRGLDMFAAVPDVFAPETAFVVKVSDGQSPPFVGYGPGVILLKGASGFYHLLSHLDFSTIKVTPGQFIADGQLIAQFDRDIGHTHYEVRREATGDSETNNIDPAVWLTQQQQKLVAATPAQTSNAKNVVIGVVAVTGLFGLSWLALRIAKHAATPV